MPTRITGLKGYVAEALVERWLRRRYAAPKYEIVHQIIPTDVDRRGGGHLDFGVVEDRAVIEVYEVKGQDYIFGKDSAVNKPLIHIWQSRGKPLEFATQDGRTFPGAVAVNGYLVLLVPPNHDWITMIGTANLRFVKLFREIWSELESDEGQADIIEDIMRDLASDIREVISILKKPSQGARMLQRFVELRDGQRSPGAGVEIGESSDDGERPSFVP